MILHIEYFKVYGDYVASGCTSRLAWVNTEKDLYKQYGCRKYRTHAAFKTCFGSYRRRKQEMKKIVLHTVEEFEIKKT